MTENHTIELEAMTRHAQRLAAMLDLVLHEAHPVYGSTTKWLGGIGGQAMTSHCSLTQGAPPGDEWAEWGMPSKPLREFMEAHPFALGAAKQQLKDELTADLEAEITRKPGSRNTTGEGGE